jgi:hypothetical protein
MTRGRKRIITDDLILQEPFFLQIESGSRRAHNPPLVLANEACARKGAIAPQDRSLHGAACAAGTSNAETGTLRHARARSNASCQYMPHAAPTPSSHPPPPSPLPTHAHSPLRPT